jgi:FkbM family methyltransferase
LKRIWGHWLAAACRNLPLPIGPGRIFERVRWRLGGMAYRMLGPVDGDREVRTVRARTGARMQLSLGEFVDRTIYCTGEWEPREAQLIRARLRPGDCMVDVGAYVGYFTLMAARLVGPHGRVLAFEANPETYRKLAANVALNGFLQVEMHHCAVGDVAGQHAKVASRQAGNAGGDYTEFGAAAGGSAVEVVRLDQSLDGPVRIVKIDIEGAELKALRGAGALLRGPDAPDLVLEFTPAFIRQAGDDPAELLALLHAEGYRVQAITPRDLRPLPDDACDRPQAYLYCTKDRAA